MNYPSGVNDSTIEHQFGNQDMIECPDCEESGMVEKDFDETSLKEQIRSMIFNFPWPTKPCPRCDGDGYIPDERSLDDIKRDKEEEKADMKDDLNY
jgi:hypothetical protein